ncbi:hypothetical protein POF50_005510 [Streptomyces sp. SL13]|uniref:Uncharacterized protein n=1 Tax=Streptantibioticus silvisoli TaxID=2705255 RepID=A0AA90KF52_9ACTN|nr:hypothetical protein [Streptantibioticus silvisoli]MDI5968805.1 hypothetical protein [Streptantibioticus silvisoli]
MGAAPAGGNATAPLSELVRVTRPTTIELQAQRVDSAGTATFAQVASDSAGFTSLLYHQISTPSRW